MLTHNVTGLRHCVIFLLQNCQLFFIPFYYYYQLLYNIAALVANKVSYIIIYGSDVTITIVMCCYSYVYTATFIIVRFDSDGAALMPFNYLVFITP